MSEKWEVEVDGVDKYITNELGQHICTVFNFGAPDEVWSVTERIAALPELEAKYKEAVGALQACYDELQSLASLQQSMGEHARNMAKAALAKAEVK